MRNYPHGLDDEVLAEDLEVDRETIDEIEPDLEEAIAEENAMLVGSLGEAYYFAACHAYALGATPDEIRPQLARSLELGLTAFRFGLVIDVYEYLRLLALARVLGQREAAEALAAADRERYTDEDVEADELVFAAAALLAALIVRDDAAADKILAAFDPDTFDAQAVFRYDRMIYFPLLRMLAAIRRADPMRLAAALQSREKDFIAFFKRADQKNDAEALLDLPGLAALALARVRGLPFTDTSVYRPSGF